MTMTVIIPVIKSNLLNSNVSGSIACRALVRNMMKTAIKKIYRPRSIKKRKMW
jgi:hypothetical protein